MVKVFNITLLFAIATGILGCNHQEKHNEVSLLGEDTLSLRWYRVDQSTRQPVICINNVSGDLLCRDSTDKLIISKEASLPDSNKLSAGGLTLVLNSKKKYWNDTKFHDLDLAFKPDTFHQVYIHDMSYVGQIKIYNDSAQIITLHNLQVSAIDISRPRADNAKQVKGYRYPKVQIENSVSDDDIDQSNLIDTESVQYKTISKLVSGNVARLHLKDCVLLDSSLDCSFVEELYFNNIKYDFQHLTLQVDKYERSSKRDFEKTKLHLKHIDAAKFNFDYTFFHYQPYDQSYYGNQENDWKSDVLANYQNIITSQTRQHNLQGIEDASIEMGIFQDRQIPVIGGLIVFVKQRWNNYGFDKGRVVIASTVLFLISYLINCFLFPLLLETYDVSNINQARQESFERNRKFSAVIYRLALCGFFTGIIFYGIKIELTAFKFKKIFPVIILLSEYIIGIISLAYIANLIITK